MPHKQARTTHWKASATLLPPLAKSAYKLIDALPEALEKVWPLSRAHRRDLPRDIKDLSAMLTCQRSQLRHNYWSKPAWISAYLYYFLPWNLVRLCRLLQALDLPQPELKQDALPLLLDGGSGPLTAPLALWIARPQWRAAPISVFALDAVKQPLQLGRALFNAMAQISGQEPWPIRIETGPIEALGRLAPRASAGGEPLLPWLAAAANTLNELKASQSAAEGGESRFEDLLEEWAPIWQSGAPLLFVEPGTRLGGAIIMRLRAAALELGLHPAAPCVHSNACPLYEPERAALPSTWCHFIFSAQDAPDWLRNLSREARLFKTSLTLAPLLLQRVEPPRKRQGMAVRVISQPFPARESICRYGCAKNGLCLLPGARSLISGSLCEAEEPEDAEKDPKSGAAIILPFAGADSGRQRAGAPSGQANGRGALKGALKKTCKRADKTGSRRS